MHLQRHLSLWYRQPMRFLSSRSSWLRAQWLPFFSRSSWILNSFQKHVLSFHSFNQIVSFSQLYFTKTHLWIAIPGEAENEIHCGFSQMLPKCNLFPLFPVPRHPARVVSVLVVPDYPPGSPRLLHRLILRDHLAIWHQSLSRSHSHIVWMEVYLVGEGW